MSTKRQTTFAKIQREQAVKERRARKQQRRQERLDEKKRVAEAQLAPDAGDVSLEGEATDGSLEATDGSLEADGLAIEHPLDAPTPAV